MNYELCLELKNAGFPQLLGKDFILPHGEVILGHMNLRSVEGMVRLPTLSELIEWCGEELDEFHNLSNKWIAVRQRPIFGEYTSAEGSSPEEAVARLYLAINKK